MAKRIQIPNTGFLSVPIGRDMEAEILGVRMVRAEDLQFDLGLKDRRQEGRLFGLTFPAYLTPTSSLSEFLDNTFDIRLEKGEVFEPETLIGRPLIVQFGPPDADGRQAIVRTKPITPKPQIEGDSSEDRGNPGTDQ